LERFGLTFAIWWKLLTFCADLVISFLVYKIALQNMIKKEYALICVLLYIYNPISIHLTSIHGQIDQFVFMFVLLSIHSYQSFRDRSLILISLFLILATYFKPYAFFFFIVFFFRYPLLRDKFILTIIYFSGLFLPYIAVNDLYLSMKSMYGTIKYGGGGGGFGLGWVLELINPYLFDLYNNIYKIIILLSVVVVSYFNRNKDLVYTNILIVLVVYITAVGLAPQYLYWVIPLAVLRPNIYLLLYTAVAYANTLIVPYILVSDQMMYVNYQQFVPLISLEIFYNYWFFTEYLKPMQILLSNILGPLIVLLWIISAKDIKPRQVF